MKKKKKRFQEETADKKPLFSQERLRQFIIKNKIVLVLFAFGFIFSLINSYTASEINPVIRPGSDSHFYYIISQQVKEQIFDRFFGFIFGVIGNTFSIRDYQVMGFVENDIQSIFRAPAGVFFYGFFFFLLGVSYHTVLIVNALSYGVQIALVYLISKELFPGSKKIPFIITGLFFFYIPFHIMVMFSYLETIINLVLLLLIYFYILAIKEKKTVYFFLTGFLIYFSALMKISIQYLGFLLFFVLIYLIYRTYHGKERKRIMKSFIAGFLSILIVWKLISFRATGEFNLTSVTWSKVTAATAGRVGWSAIAPSSSGLGNNVFRDSTKYFRQAVDQVPIDRNNLWFSYSYVCQKALNLAMKNEFFPILFQSIKKSVFLVVTPMESMIKHVDRKFIFSFLTGVPNYLYHNFIMLLFFFNLFFFYKDFQKRLILYGIIVFHFITYGVTIALPRYITNAMPFIIILCGATLMWLGHYYKEFLKVLVKRKINILIALLLLITGLIANGLIIKIISIILFFFSFGFLIYRISNHFLEKPKPLISSIIIFSFFIVIYGTFLISDKDLDEEKTIVEENTQVVEQNIILPDDFNLEKYDQAVLMIDAKIRGENSMEIKVKINDTIVKEFNRGFPSQGNILYYKEVGIYFTYRERKWVAIPFSTSLLKKNNKVQIIPAFPEGEINKLVLYSDKKDKPGKFIGPSFFKNWKTLLNGNNVSLWTNYLDTRHIDEYQVKSIKREGFVKANDKDIACGNLRIYLLLKNKGGYYIKEEYQRLDQFYVGFIGLFKPLENKMVEWLPGPKTGFVTAGDRVRTYLESEFDRYYTGYDVF